MDSRTRNTLSGRFAEAGFLYVVVVVFVSLVFLIREGWDYLSYNPTISRTTRTTITGAPGYYGRNP